MPIIGRQKPNNSTINIINNLKLRSTNKTEENQKKTLCVAAGLTTKTGRQIKRFAAVHGQTKPIVNKHFFFLRSRTGRRI